MMIKITLKAAIWDFFNLLTAPWTVSDIYTKVARVQWCGNHVLHMECLSCATHGDLIMCDTWSAYHARHMECLCVTHGVLMCNTLSAYHVLHMECLSCATHGVLIMCYTWSAYHVLHMECLSCATHGVLIMCDMCAMWCGRTAQLLSVAGFTSHLFYILALFYWLKH